LAGPSFEPVITYEESFDGLYGLQTDGAGLAPDGSLRGRLVVGQPLLGAEDALHGGIPAAIAESLASQGTAMAVAADGLFVSGLSNDTTVIVRVAAGTTLQAVATPRGRGADLWVWAVELRDDTGTLCAFSRVTIAVRPPRRAA
jgi:1,4-dihydroxy-2-naphthoyl-CoA hydrolase